jgi:hypothetical protein
MLGNKRTAIAVAAWAATAALAVGVSNAASAPAAHPALTFALVPAAAGGATPAVVPNSNIVKRLGLAVFRPAKLAVHSVTGRCTITNDSFTVSNTIRPTQQLTYRGASFGPPIPKNFFLAICTSGSGRAALGIASNPAAKLRVTFS